MQTAISPAVTITMLRLGGVLGRAVAPPGSRLLRTAIGTLAPEVEHGLNRKVTAAEGGRLGVVVGIDLSTNAPAAECSTALRPEVAGALAVTPLKVNEVRVFSPTAPDQPVLALVGLRKSGPKPDEYRAMAGNASRALRSARASHIRFDLPSAGAKALGEGSALGLHEFREYLKAKVDEDGHPEPAKEIRTIGLASSSSSSPSFAEGVILGAAQNSARRLAEMPSNVLTPRAFADFLVREAQGIPHLTVTVRDRAWIEAQGMRSFLRVAIGSDEPPVLVELGYHPVSAAAAPSSGSSRLWSADRPLCLVGKGITFDSGGISIKPSGGMGKMKADMQGAACVASAIIGAARLGLPVNVHGILPICENMPSGRAAKPGDVVFARSGRSIEIDNTDAEGRLILCDALDYAATDIKPSAIIDAATLTGAIDVALGSGASGAFVNSEPLWQALDAAGSASGDLLWRMPLFPLYREMMNGTITDLVNSSEKRSAGACTAAAFLAAFVPKGMPWAHLDIAGVMHASKTAGYDVRGMTGRPTRTLLEFLAAQAK